MRTRGIVVRKIELKEYDQLVVVYTEEFGKISAVVKSISKPKSKQAAHVDLINLIDFTVVKGRIRPIIASALSLETYPLIKKSLIATGIAMFLLETIDKSVYDYDPDHNLWNFFESSFSYINSIAPSISPLNYERVLNNIQQNLLSVMGYQHPEHSKNIRMVKQAFEDIGQASFGSLQFLKSVIQ